MGVSQTKDRGMIFSPIYAAIDEPLYANADGSGPAGGGSPPPGPCDVGWLRFDQTCQSGHIASGGI